MNFFLFLSISSILYSLNVSSLSLKCYANERYCWLKNLLHPNCNLTSEKTCDKPAHCITIVGTEDNKLIRYKECDYSGSIEDRGTCAGINISCSICDYDNCNKGGSLTCYSCSDNLRCINTFNHTCFDENFSCYSARGYDNELVKERGCVPNENIKAEYERYKEKGFTYSVCNNSDLCNTDRTGPLLTCLDHYGEESCAGHDNFVCINAVKYRPYRGCMMKDAIKEYCKVDNRTGDLLCYVCEKDLCNVKGNLCYECSYDEKCIPRLELNYNCLTKDDDCFTAKGIEDGKPVLEKGCISKNRVGVASKQYAKKNLSFTACYGDLCNAEHTRGLIVCYICFGADDCRAETCPTDDFSCISVRGRDKDGQYIVIKDCVFGESASYECDKYKKRGLSCSVCKSDLCNLIEDLIQDPTDDPTQDPTEEDNYTEIEDSSVKRDDNPTETDSYHTERMYLSESSISSIFSVILPVTMLTCTRLL